MPKKIKKRSKKKKGGQCGLDLENVKVIGPKITVVLSCSVN